MRPALAADGLGVGRDQALGRRHVPRRRGGVQRRAAERRPLRQQLGRPPPARRVVVAVDEAGEAQELVDERGVVFDGPADRLPVRGAGVALDDAEVLAQLRFQLGNP